MALDEIIITVRSLGERVICTINMLNDFMIFVYWLSEKKIDVVDPLCFAGNGPSALSLSYLLSGNVPYYIPHQHPNVILDQKLSEEPGKSLLDTVSLTTD